MLLNDLRKNITDTIIQSNLSIDCIYFVLRDNAYLMLAVPTFIYFVQQEGFYK